MRTGRRSGRGHAGGRRVRDASRRRLGFLAVAFEKRVAKPAEAEPLVEGEEPVAVRLALHQRLDLEGQRDVRLHRHERPAGGQPVERLPQVLADGTLHLVRVRHDA